MYPGRGLNVFLRQSVQGIIGIRGYIAGGILNLGDTGHLVVIVGLGLTQRVGCIDYSSWRHIDSHYPILPERIFIIPRIKNTLINVIYTNCESINFLEIAVRRASSTRKYSFLIKKCIMALAVLGSVIGKRDPLESEHHISA